MRFRARHAILVLLLASVSVLAQASKPAGESSSKPHAKARENAASDPGTIADGVYRNPSLSLSYKIPFGWVDRTSDMREGSELGKSMVLLAVFERPPEAQAEGINPAVVIVAESTSSYPDLTTAADYFGPITELATANSFTVDNPPYDFPVGAKHLVRGDFVKEKDSASVRQTSLVFLQKSWIVSLTFIGTGDDEIDELLGRLSFQGPSVNRSSK